MYSEPVSQIFSNDGFNIIGKVRKASVSPGSAKRRRMSSVLFAVGYSCPSSQHSPHSKSRLEAKLAMRHVQIRTLTAAAEREGL